MTIALTATAMVGRSRKRAPSRAKSATTSDVPTKRAAIPACPSSLAKWSGRTPSSVPIVTAMSTIAAAETAKAGERRTVRSEPKAGAWRLGGPITGSTATPRTQSPR